MKNGKNPSAWFLGALVLGLILGGAVVKDAVASTATAGTTAEAAGAEGAVADGTTADGTATAANAASEAAGASDATASTTETPAVETAESAAAKALAEAAQEKTAEKGPAADASEADEGTPAPSRHDQMTLWDFIKKGGLLMYPIGLMSLIVVAIGLDRFIALSRGFVLPAKLFSKLELMLKDKKTDPRQVYQLCRQFPSAASSVIQSLLLKAGRPMSEVQTQFQVAKDDEAERLYAKVRWLTLAAAVTPLMGLLGTVLGMIQAFKETAAMSTAIGVNRAEQLSEGIYLALITTCAGLIVAIPAAILAHWYEARILALFRLLDRKLISFFAYMERLEDKVAVTPEQYENYREPRTEGTGFSSTSSSGSGSRRK